MAELGTPLSELDGARPTDMDLVDSIMADLNQPSGGRPAPPPPAPAARMPMQQNAPMPSTYPNAADPSVPTAHMIGKDHPTEADFQRMMMAAQEPLPYNAMAPQMAAPPAPSPPPQAYEEPKKNWQGQWVDELKQPLLVALVFFVLTLPAVNLLFNHYAPSLLRPGGDFTTVGLVARSLAGGALFWVLTRVVGPLVNL